MIYNKFIDSATKELSVKESSIFDNINPMNSVVHLPKF